jgi:hypothetical protein
VSWPSDCAPTTRTSKILFMSGYTDSILAEYQGMPLMPKPFSGPALTQAVRDVLDERPAPEHAPLV